MFLPIPLYTCTPGYKQNLRYTLIFTQFLQWFAINWWPLSAAKLQSVQIQPCHALVETITMAYGGYNIPHLSHSPYTALYTIQRMPSTRVCECIIAIYCSHHFFIKSRHKDRNKKYQNQPAIQRWMWRGASMNQEMSTPARHPKAQTGRWQILCGTHPPPGPRSMAFWQTMALAMFGYIMLLYGGFLKWGYPKMDGLKWEILYQNEWLGGTSILGNLHRYMSGTLLAEEMLFFSQQLLSVWLYPHIARFRHCHDQRFQNLGDNVSKACYSHGDIFNSGNLPGLWIHRYINK